MNRHENISSRPELEVTASRHFPAWLAQQGISLAISTYQAGKLLLLGTGPEGRLSVFERTFDRCMGLWSNGQTLWLASAFQLWRLENVLDEGELSDGYDRLFVPRAGYITGDIDVHDVAIDSENEVVFVSTLFSCLATISHRHNFHRLWQPPFISRLGAEDRCHLNGLAMENGRPRYMTACSQSDLADGWRDHREGGGCLLDVSEDAVIGEGLSMPHSPRLHGDRLWLLNAGTGDFGYWDLASARFEPVAFCPGYARGLTFVGDHAVVALSKARESTFQGLPLDRKLEHHRAAARCGLQVIDLASGDVVHWLRIEGAVAELYDVVALPGAKRPKALGFKTEEIRHNVWLEEGGRSHRWTGQPKP